MARPVRQPRLIPYVGLPDLLGVANVPQQLSHGHLGKVHRACLEYALDPEVNDISLWIQVWRKRWPDLEEPFWRLQYVERGFDVERTRVWAEYADQAIVAFVRQEVEARSQELRDLSEIRSAMLTRLRSTDVATAVRPNTYEGMVGALVKLDQHLTERRDDYIRRVSVATPQGPRPAGQAPGPISLPPVAIGGEIVDTYTAEQSKIRLDPQTAQRLARAALLMDRQKEEVAGEQGEDDPSGGQGGDGATRGGAGARSAQGG